MKISARNCIKGTIRSIECGAVNAEIILEISDQVCLSAVITKKSCEALGLKVGHVAHAVIKASDVMLAVDE